MIRRDTWPSILLTLLALVYPFRLIVRKDRPEIRLDLVWTFVIYLVLVASLSVPFVLL